MTAIKNGEKKIVENGNVQKSKSQPKEFSKNSTFLLSGHLEKSLNFRPSFDNSQSHSSNEQNSYEETLSITPGFCFDPPGNNPPLVQAEQGEKDIPPGVSQTNLYVCGLPLMYTCEQLRELFSRFGKIKETRVLNNAIIAESKGVGFVHFENAENASKAVTVMNNTIPAGIATPLVVKFARDIRKNSKKREDHHSNGEKSFYNVSTNTGNNFLPSTFASNTPCKFFLHGACNKGSECHFSHSLIPLEYSNSNDQYEEYSETEEVATQPHAVCRSEIEDYYRWGVFSNENFIKSNILPGENKPVLRALIENYGKFDLSGIIKSRVSSFKTKQGMYKEFDGEQLTQRLKVPFQLNEGKHRFDSLINGVDKNKSIPNMNIRTERFYNERKKEETGESDLNGRLKKDVDLNGECSPSFLNGYSTSNGHSNPGENISSKPTALNGANWSNKEGKNSSVQNGYTGTSKTNLYVSQFPREWTSADLEEKFSEYGEIDKIRILTPDTAEKQRGVGFVHFKSTKSALNALDSMQNFFPKDCYKPIIVKFANQGVKPIRAVNINSGACRYWLKGECSRGEMCSFRHDPLEGLSTLPSQLPFKKGSNVPSSRLRGASQVQYSSLSNLPKGIESESSSLKNCGGAFETAEKLFKNYLGISGSSKEV